MSLLYNNKYCYINKTKTVINYFFLRFNNNPHYFVNNKLVVLSCNKNNNENIKNIKLNLIEKTIKVQNISENSLKFFNKFKSLIRNKLYSTLSNPHSNSDPDNKKDDDRNENDKNKKRRSLPKLMDFPEIIWPSIVKSFKNWILISFIIRPYFDREFNLPDFVYGAKHALQIVSTKLAEGDLSSLSGLVTTEAINELKNVISRMSVAQRMELSVNKNDIYLTFPYQIGIMFDESNQEVQKRWVEITMVFHVLRGFKEMQEKGQSPPLNISSTPEYRDQISICNYRFIKEFTQGNESEWTINVINHFKPSDLLIE